MSLAGTGISRGLVVAAAQSTQELILDANVSVTGARHRCAGADKRRANACNLFACKYRKAQRADYIRFQQCRVPTNQTGRPFR